MIKNNKILVRINNLEEVEEYKKKGITNFLFALSDFSIGYNTFNIEDLKELNCNVYLLINRVFDNQACDNLKQIKNELLFVKGIMYADIAVYQIMKDTKIDLIHSDTHFMINSKVVNIWLNKTTSVTLSNELEQTELKYIIDNSIKPVVLPVFGYNMAMYSRRHLISYYNEYKGLPENHTAYLTTNNGIEFLAKENKYGTVFFYHKYFNLIDKLEDIDDNKILFYYIDPLELTSNEVIDVINGKHLNEDNRFYEHKTVFRIGDLYD